MEAVTANPPGGKGHGKCEKHDEPKSKPPRNPKLRDQSHSILNDALEECFNPQTPDAARTKPRKPKRHVNFIHDSPESYTPPVEVYAPPLAAAIDAPPHAQVFAPPHQKMVLQRGLQIPSRLGTITSGFKLPPLLQEHAVSVKQWNLFTKELRGHAIMTGNQFVTYVGASLGFGLVWNVISPFFGMIPCTIMSHKLAKKMEQSNFNRAHYTGALETFTKRWNENYFEHLGLRVSVEIPGNGSTDGMDVASTKLFRYQQKIGVTSPMAGSASRAATAKEARYQVKEGHQRVKAANRARIIILPVGRTPSEINTAPQETGQIDVSDALDGIGDGGPESDESNHATEPGFIPTRRLAAAKSSNPH